MWMFRVLLLVANAVGTRKARSSDARSSDLMSLPCGELAAAGIKQGLKVGSVTLETCLGGGYFAETWLAKQDDDTMFAVKILKVGVVKKRTDLNWYYDGEYGSPSHAMDKECGFAQEANKRLPQIVPRCILSSSENLLESSRVLHYAVFDLVDGQNLEDVFKSEDNEVPSILPELADVAALMNELMRAVQTLLRGDIWLFDVDLQLSNIMVARTEDGALQIHVIDFGNVVVYGGDLQLSGRNVSFEPGSRCRGMPESVEQMRGRPKNEVKAAQNCRYALRKGRSKTIEHMVSNLISILSRDGLKDVTSAPKASQTDDGSAVKAAEVLSSARRLYRPSEKEMQSWTHVLAKAIMAYWLREREEGWKMFLELAQAIEQLSARDFDGAGPVSKHVS